MSFGIPVRNGLGVGLSASTFLSSSRVGGRPAMFLNFIGATALDSRITFTRTTTATVTGSNGVIQSSAINAPRFDYNPVTLAPQGLLVEEPRINLLLNSLIDGTSLSTQNVTVAAVAHTISFYGTGTITLTGAYVATVTGTGAYPNRQTLTFTPVVGVLICAVTGSVQYAQLEAGGFATSFIPTAGTATTRAIDLASMTGTNFSSWYDQTQGSFVVSVSTFGSGANRFALGVSNGANSERIVLFATATSTLRYIVTDGNVSQADISLAGMNVNVVNKIACAYQANSFNCALNGTLGSGDTAGPLPTPDKLFIGSDASGVAPINGRVRSVAYYNTRLPNATLQTLTT